MNINIIKIYNPLYARGTNSNIKEWIGYVYEENDIVKSCTISSNITNSNISLPLKRVNEYNDLNKAKSYVSRKHTKKLKEGYREIDIINDNISNRVNTVITKNIDNNSNVTNLFNMLDHLLPKFNIRGINIIKPAKCSVFKFGKAIYHMLGQPKINGVRATLKWENITIGEGLFKSIKGKAIFRSKDGNIYYMPMITDKLKEDMFVSNSGTEIIYDGEFYIPGYKLNEINRSVPMILNSTIQRCSGNPNIVQFWNFDLAIENLTQVERFDLKRTMLDKANIPNPNNINNSIVDRNIKFVSVYTRLINSDEEALAYSKECIKLGFEGSVFRKLESTYKFGSRTIDMIKLKKKKETTCMVKDIVFKNSDSIRDYISIVLKNDLNGEVFEATPKGDEAQRQEYLSNKQDYIGGNAIVSFYERSGIKHVPFHANVIKIERRIKL